MSAMASLLTSKPNRPWRLTLVRRISRMTSTWKLQLDLYSRITDTGATEGAVKDHNGKQRSKLHRHASGKLHRTNRHAGTRRHGISLRIGSSLKSSSWICDRAAALAIPQACRESLGHVTISL